jgi:DHA1 family inner membrane transport protein
LATSIVVAAGALATAGRLAFALPQLKGGHNTNPLDACRDFKRAGLAGVVHRCMGLCGMFCVFSYMATTMLQVTRVSERWMPFAIGAFGVGSLIGAQLKAHPADD